VVWDAQNHDMKLCAHVMAEIEARMAAERPSMAGGYVTGTRKIMIAGQPVGAVRIMHYGPYFLSEGDFSFLNAMNIALTLVGALALALAIGAGALLARRIAMPIAKTAHTARAIAAGNYLMRVEDGTKIRELSELTEAINRLSDGLNAQENLRKRLAVNIAHELRTPLAAVSAHLEMMIGGMWAATPARLEGCAEEIARLSHLAEDLERLAEIEDENLKLRLSEVDLSEIALAAAQRFSAEAATKNVTLAVSGEPAPATADPERMMQVVANLLSNAIKFTPPGGTVRIEADGSSIVVEDSGIGIPNKDLPHVFERFYRADESRSRKTGGAGIGLALVKSIVEAHGGTVEVMSAPGRGSRFVVRLKGSSYS
jgi:two-component system sensor histidine kinase BaeS